MLTHTGEYAYTHREVCLHTQGSMLTYTGKYACTHREVCLHTQGSMLTHTGKYGYIHREVTKTLNNLTPQITNSVSYPKKA